MKHVCNYFLACGNLQLKITLVQFLLPSTTWTWAVEPLSTQKLGNADLILIISPYSNMASDTNTMHISIHRSINENVSDEGVFSCALPDVLIIIKRIVIKSAIRPGIISGGMMKLGKQM